jgi:D-alanyl-D-alanine carboxypeptidase (penicillin-binding protein 5/6)
VRWAAVIAAAALFAAPAAGAAPAVRAPAAIVVEPATGDVVFGRNADQRRPIASATKLMTALVVLERVSLDDVMTATPYHGLPAESVLGLRSGERMTVRDLLRALLLASANDAAATLATRVAGSRTAFVKLMNERARSLGLRNTRFANPIGLDAKANYSSAADLVKLGLVLRENPFFRTTTDLPRAVLASGSRPRMVVNRNVLVREVPFVNGMKTGHTSTAGYVLVGSGSRDGVTVLSAVLGTPSESVRNADTLALLRYALGRYRVVTAVKRNDVLGRVGLSHRGDQTVEAVAARDLRRTARRGERLQVVVQGLPDEVDGPLPQGARLGTALVRQRAKTVARVPLVTAREVDAATVLERIGSYMGRGTTLLLLGAFAVCSLYLVLLRRRAVRRRTRAGGAPAG